MPLLRRALVRAVLTIIVTTWPLCAFAEAGAADAADIVQMAERSAAEADGGEPVGPGDAADPAGDASFLPLLPSAPTVEPVVDSLRLSPAAPAPPQTRRYTRRQAVGLGLLSALFGLGSVAVDFFPAAPLFGQTGYDYHYVTELAASAPLAAVSPEDALQVGGLTLMGQAAELAAYQNNVTSPRSRAISSPVYNCASFFSLHQGAYAAYATYRDARVWSDSGASNDKWRPWTADELVVAPFRPSNWNRPVFVWTVGSEAVTAGVVLGVTYARGAKLPSGVGMNVATGLTTSLTAGVTEEAVFRGFIYEELKSNIGLWPARAIDSTAFALMHVPGELGVQSASSIAIGLLVRTGTGVLLEAAYDQGGLPASVALHTALDVVVNVASALAPSSQPTAAIGAHKVGTMPRNGEPVIVPLWSGAF